MGRYSIASFALAAMTITWMSPNTGQAQVKPKDVSFESADGMELQGTFYPAKNGGGRPTVMLLHTPFKDPNQGGWEAFAKELAELEGGGYNVLRFDFRGHGKSTVIKDTDKFWTNAVNMRYMSTLVNKKPKAITIKDFQTKTGYLPMLANDIMAARIALDTMNDRNECNTSSVYLIGANETFGLGMLFLAAEWARPHVLQQGNAIATVPLAKNWWAPAAEEAGKDIAGCVWLSAQRPMSITTDALKKFVANTPNQKMRDDNSMLFINGELDTQGTGIAKTYLNDVFVANGKKELKIEPMKLTTNKTIAKSKASGVDLLGKVIAKPADPADPNSKKELEPCATLIIEYLTTLDKDRKNKLPTQRHYTKPPLINGPALNVLNVN